MFGGQQLDDFLVRHLLTTSFVDDRKRTVSSSLPVLAVTASSLIRGPGFEFVVFMSGLHSFVQRTLFRVALVSDSQPMFHFVVDII